MDRDLPALCQATPKEEMEALMGRLGTTERRPLEDCHVNFGLTFSFYAKAWEALSDRVFKTILPDEECIRTLNIHDDLVELFGRLGMERLWEHLMNRQEDQDLETSTDLVSELLSTLRIRKIGLHPKSIRFRLGGQQRELSVDDLNDIFGCPRDPRGEAFRMVQEYDRDEFWVQISRRPFGHVEAYSAKYSKCTKLRNPVLRYLEKILASILFGKGEGGAVNTEELYVLYCFVHNRPFNFAATLVLQWEKLLKKRPSGVRNGGMVTLIARHFGVDSFLVEEGSNLNLGVCDRSHMVKNRAEQWCFMQLDKELFPLNDPALITVLNQNSNNLHFGGRAHLRAATALYNRLIAEGVRDVVDPRTGDKYASGVRAQQRNRRGARRARDEERVEEEREVEEIEAGGDVPMDEAAHDEEGEVQRGRAGWAPSQEEWTNAMDEIYFVSRVMTRVFTHLFPGEDPNELR